MLSLRDYFAAAALQGLLSNNKFFKTSATDDCPESGEHDCGLFCDLVFEIADAMLKARES